MQRLLFRLLGSTYRSETYESVQTTWVRSDRSDLQSEIGRIPIPWRSSSKGERDARQETGDSPRAMERGVPDPIKAQTQRPTGDWLIPSPLATG